jgi:hypothetical protein
VALRGTLRVDEFALLEARDPNALMFTMLGSDLSLSVQVSASDHDLRLPADFLVTWPPYARLLIGLREKYSSYGGIGLMLSTKYNGVSIWRETLTPPPPPCLVVNEAWRSLVTSCADRMVDQSKPVVRLLVTGRKDVGKSTFVRCLINAALAISHCTYILYLTSLFCLCL